MRRPSNFYRYRSLAGNGRNFTKSIVVENRLYFAAPRDLNDPYDCRPNFSLNRTEKAFDFRFGAIELRGSDDDLDEIKKRYWKRIESQNGVLCLSAVANSALMWSHYADSHRGVCLQFDAEHWYFTMARPINYAHERAIIDPWNDDNHTAEEAGIYTKSRDWAYEAEWRIGRNHFPGSYSFPSEALTGVILGANISEVNEREVRSWIDKRSTGISLFRCRLSECTYGIEIQPDET